MTSKEPQSAPTGATNPTSEQQADRPLGDAACSLSSFEMKETAADKIDRWREEYTAREAARQAEREETAFARTVAGLKAQHADRVEALEILSRLCEGLPTRERNLIRTLIR